MLDKFYFGLRCYRLGGMWFRKAVGFIICRRYFFDCFNAVMLYQGVAGDYQRKIRNRSFSNKQLLAHVLLSLRVT
jgi:hypothetical protein